jgi:hypothetical protein
MIHRKQLSQLSYEIKRRTFFRFFLLFSLETAVNKLLTQYGLSISVLIFCWVIFTKKYFNFHIGLGLFCAGFVAYFCFYPFTFFQLLLTAIAMFCAAHAIDIDKLSALAAFFVQNFLFILFDFDFNSRALMRSSLLSLMAIAIVKSDIVPLRIHRRKTLLI